MNRYLKITNGKNPVSKIDKKEWDKATKIVINDSDDGVLVTERHGSDDWYVKVSNDNIVGFHQNGADEPNFHKLTTFDCRGCVKKYLNKVRAEWADWEFPNDIEEVKLPGVTAVGFPECTGWVVIFDKNF